MELKTINPLLYIFLIGIIGLSIFFRFYNLGMGSYWYDELYSVQLAKHTSRELLNNTYFDPGNPPLHPFILSPWMFYFGNTEAATRSLSGVLSIIAIVAFYFLVKNYVQSSFTRLVTITLYIVAWMHIWGARETRYYSLLLFISTLVVLIFTKVLRRNRNLDIFVFAFVSILGLLTHYSFAILILGCMLVWLTYARTKKILIYFLIVCLPLFPFFLTRMNVLAIGNNQPFWIKLNSVFQYDITGKIHDTPMSIVMFVKAILFAAPNYLRLIFVCVFGASIVYFIVKEELSKKEERVIAMLGILVSISLLSPLNRILNNAYYFFFLTPVFFLVFGIIISKLFVGWRLGVGTVLVSIFLYSNLIYLSNHSYYFNTWHIDRMVGDMIQRNIPVVIFGNGDIRFIAEYYFDHNPSKKIIKYDSDVFFSFGASTKRVAFVGYEGNKRFWEKVDVNALVTKSKLSEERAYGNGVIMRYYTP